MHHISLCSFLLSGVNTPSSKEERWSRWAAKQLLSPCSLCSRKNIHYTFKMPNLSRLPGQEPTTLSIQIKTACERRRHSIILYYQHKLPTRIMTRTSSECSDSDKTIPRCNKFLLQLRPKCRTRLHSTLCITIVMHIHEIDEGPHTPPSRNKWFWKKSCQGSIV